MKVSLHDILNAREARARQQRVLLAEYRAPLLCFTMNIAGPVKVTALVEEAFQTGLAILDGKLPREKILFREIKMPDTGCEAIFAVSMPAQALKVLCTEIEETHPLGRLFDMDVIDTDGNKLERKGERSCMVCGAPGRCCAASRAHSVAKLQAVTKQILDRERIAALAVESLIDEVRTTPKPGLVDLRNNGSHKDMDIHLFEASARALKPYFARCVQIGQETAQLPAAEVFPLLRKAGLEAEKAMYAATGGVNTHKGAIYTLGVLCGSVGRLGQTGVDGILTECARIVSASVQADFASADGKTAGEQLYLQHGLRGIRGEVADGLPSVRRIGLPTFRQALADGFSKNDAGVYALLHLIAKVEDTNLYHRGGKMGACWASGQAGAFLVAHTYPTIKSIEKLDDAFIARKLSPGGCADLLAVTFFLNELME